MGYKVGDMVVYPRHGAAKVEAITERTVKGITREYLQLSVLSSDGLVINVPVDNAKKVGVRDIVDANEVAKVFEILRTPIIEKEMNWSRRYKLNVEKIATGDVNKIAEVVRDLAQRDVDEHGLSAGEKRMLTKARSILTSEISLSEHLDEAEAQRLLDVNLGYEPAQPGDEEHHTEAPEEAAMDTLARVEAESKKLWLACLRWDGDGIEGDSDGDVAAHALIDALLSAAGLGDIGTLFGVGSQSDGAGKHGAEMLRTTVDYLNERGMKPVSASVVVIANRPKIGKHREEAERALSEAIGCEVSMTATTTDGMGFTGSGEGVAAIADALVEPVDPSTRQAV